MRIPFRQTIGRALASATRAGWMSAAQFLTLGNLYRSSGSPEGVVTASYGICIDETNKKLYEKVSGTGTTGWREVSPSVAGTWTPVCTPVTNLDSVTPSAGFYARVGAGSNDVVIASFEFIYDATAAGAVYFRTSLPVTSNLTSTAELNGGIFGAGTTEGRITGDATNDAATCLATTASTSAVTARALFMYKVLQ